MNKSTLKFHEMHLRWFEYLRKTRKRANGRREKRQHPFARKCFTTKCIGVSFAYTQPPDNYTANGERKSGVRARTALKKLRRKNKP